MKNLISFLCLLIISLSCSKGSNTDLSNDLKVFFKENQLDKRTTYLDAVLDSKTIVGKSTDEKLADEFVTYVNETRNKTFENKIEVIIPEKAYVHNSVSNVRTEPRHGAELSTQYLMGQQLKVLTQENGWLYVQGPDNYLGWIDAGGLILEKDTSTEWLNAPKLVFQINEGQAYYADKPSQPATDLVFGNILGQTENGNFVTPSGVIVTITDPNAFAKTETSDSIDRVFERAYSLLGRPYLWGGTSPKGVDCSGFTRTSFLNADYMLGRDASLQVHEGIEIDKDDQSQWKPGDLVFFGNLREDGSERISHVALHIANGDIIHSTQWVKIESLNPESDLFNEDRFNTIMHVKRIFNQ